MVYGKSNDNNPDKFKAIILKNSRNIRNCEPVNFETENVPIEAIETVEVLGITIDNRLSAQEDISEVPYN